MQLWSLWAENQMANVKVFLLRIVEPLKMTWSPPPGSRLWLRSALFRGLPPTQAGLKDGQVVDMARWSIWPRPLGHMPGFRRPPWPHATWHHMKSLTSPRYRHHGGVEKDVGTAARASRRSGVHCGGWTSCSRGTMSPIALVCWFQ